MVKPAGTADLLFRDSLTDGRVVNARIRDLGLGNPAMNGRARKRRISLG